MRRMQPVKILAICAVVSAVAVVQASAALVGGTYTNGGTAGQQLACRCNGHREPDPVQVDDRSHQRHRRSRLP